MKEALELSLTSIAREQMPNGSFYSLSGDESLTQTKESQTVFHTSLILECLSVLKYHKKVKGIADLGCKFLLRQKNLDWTWTYWQKGTRKDPLPDFDDTSLALHVLSEYSQGSVDGAVLASFTKHLIHAETEVGGPYNTWIIPKFGNVQKELWTDVDIVVNANIKNFLHSQNIDLPNITYAHEQYIRNKTTSSKYYRSPVVTLYFIARTYHGRLTRRVAARILTSQQKHGLWVNDLETALAVSTLIRLRTPREKYQKAIDYLIQIGSAQKFAAFPLYIEERIGIPTYSGSRALTAACIAEAIALYDAENRIPNTHKPNNKLHALQENVVAQTHKRLTKYPEHIQTEIKSTIKTVVDHDICRQITLLPYHFVNSLKTSTNLTHQKMCTLGIANLLGWVGYRVYDQILDGENAVNSLSWAHIIMRNVASIYRSFLSPNNLKVFEEIMGAMDCANDWERRNANFGIQDCVVTFHRLPAYGNHRILSDKSLGHMLGPVTILLNMGYKENSPEMNHLKNFFHHYLVARQMNDDAHDWFADLKRGFVNSASTLTLHSWTRKFARGRIYHTINVNDAEHDLHAIFWKKSMLTVSNSIAKHLDSAHKELKNNPIFKNTLYFESLLKPIEKSLETALAERKKMLEFIASY